MAGPYQTGVKNSVEPGTVLASTPRLRDQKFARSVLLITENHDQGTTGFILNQPLDAKLSRLMHSKRIPYAGEEADIHTGGPVKPSALVMIHTPEWHSTNTMMITPEFCITSDENMLDLIASGYTPRLWKLCAGMSCWFPGQLDAEAQRGDWLVLPGMTAPQLLRSTGAPVWQSAVELAAEIAVHSWL